MATSGFLETKNSKLQADIQDVPVIVRTVLGQLGWGNFFFDKGLATADRRKQLRKAGMNRMLEHRIQVKWHRGADSGGVHLKVQIEDGDGHATTEQLKDSCLEVLKGIFGRAKELKEQGPEEKRTTFGSAQWAKQSDLNQVGYVISGSERPDPLRLVLGVTDDGKEVRAQAEDSVRHAIVSGPTGSGKTSRVLIPNLIKRFDSSVIVTEATAGDEPPDLYHKTSGFRKALGSKVYYFNPDDLTSHRINPIDQLKNVDDVQVLANLIIENTNKKDGGGGEQIWDNSERHLLTALLLHAAGNRQSLLDVRNMLTSGQEGMKQRLLASPVEKARSEYMAFYNVSSEGFRNGVISGLMVRLNLWVSPRIAALTSTTDIDMDALEREVFSLYLAVPAQKGHLKPLAALVFNYVLSRATDRTFAKPIFLCLDEFTNFGRIPDFANKISIIRHRNLGTILGFQDYVQLEKTYGREDAKNLWNNIGTKVLFKPNDLETAKKISDSLGMETFFERKILSSGQIQEREFGRPLLSPGEVLAMSDDRAIVFTRRTSPIKMRTYTWKEFTEETSMEPCRREKLAVDEALLKTCENADQTPPWQSEWMAENPPELLYIRKHIENTEEPSQERRREPEVPDVQGDEGTTLNEDDRESEKRKEIDTQRNEPEQDRYGRGSIV